jgi:hypothetical protein
VEQRPDREFEKRPQESPRRRSESNEFWDNIGLDIEGMSPKAQVATSLTVLIPVVITGAAVLTLFANFWWLIFVFGWTAFPAFGLLVRGIAGLSEGTAEPSPSGGRIQERDKSSMNADATQPPLVSSVPAAIGPRGQIGLALAMMVPLATLLAGPGLIYRIVPELGASIEMVLDAAFLWLVLLSLFLLFNGLRGLVSTAARARRRGPSGAVGSAEREVLSALRDHGELTPAQVAMETPLTVEEADGMLKDLAAKGHLEVRVRGGGIFYGLWRGEEAERRGLEEGH